MTRLKLFPKQASRRRRLGKLWHKCPWVGSQLCRHAGQREALGPGVATAGTLENSVFIFKTYLKKQKKSQLNNLTIHIKQLEKEEQKKPEVSRRKEIIGASLVVQWLRICLPMQGTRVRALVWEDPTCRGATGPVSHSY